MRRVLIIDDDETVVGSLSLTLQERFPDAELAFESDFDAAVARVDKFNPDVVVLDLRRGLSPSNLPGQATWQLIWTRRFCPIVLYTAGDGELDPPVPDCHPFVKRVVKGPQSESTLVETLGSLRPHIEAIESLRAELSTVIHQVLRDTAGAGLVGTESPVHLLHAGRRRIAAAMDSPAHDQRPLLSWEIYLVPPVGSSPLMGDVLQRRNSDRASPESYRLVLTPSCDMVKGRQEPHVLVARCVAVSVLIEKLSLSLQENKRAKSAERLRTEALNPGVHAGLVPLPAFPGRFPCMASNLKALEVIPFDAIDPDALAADGFDRVASIDSPFREQVAWAFLTTAARPGMPIRDLVSWAAECIQLAAGAPSPAPASPAVPRSESGP